MARRSSFVSFPDLQPLHVFSPELTVELAAREDEAASYYDPYCPHGVYVGGCGPDYMCGACESGECPVCGWQRCDRGVRCIGNVATNIARDHVRLKALEAKRVQFVRDMLDNPTINWTVERMLFIIDRLEVLVPN